MMASRLAIITLILLASFIIANIITSNIPQIYRTVSPLIGSPEPGGCNTCECKGTCNPSSVSITGPPVKPGHSGLLIPWYGTYNATVMIQIHNKHPSVPIIMISGRTDQARLRAAGIKVLCYVDTAGGGFTIQKVESTIDTGCVGKVDGVFFDDFVADSSHVSYYNTVGAYAKSKGLSITVEILAGQLHRRTQAST